MEYHREDASASGPFTTGFDISKDTFIPINMPRPRQGG